MASTIRRRRPARRKLASSFPRPGTWWLVGAGTVAAIAVLLFATFASSSPPVTGTTGIVDQGSVPSRFDFPVSLYQGEETIGSSRSSFSSLLGNQPIVLNYWASNCAPCSAEMPEFQKVYEAYEGRVLFFGLDIGRFAGFGGPEDSMRELRSLGVTYPAAPAPDLATIQRLRVIGLPTTEFITPEGEVIRSWVGMLNEERLTELIESLLEVS